MTLFANTTELVVIRETKTCFFVHGKTREIAVGKSQVFDGKIKYGLTFTESQAVELGFAENLQSARKMQNDFFNRVAKTKF
jgi:hypothetical protein